MRSFLTLRFSDHARGRMLQRGVDVYDAWRALETGVRIADAAGAKWAVYAHGLMLIVATELHDLTVMTCFPASPRQARRRIADAHANGRRVTFERWELPRS